jgi:branched-chain amino acid transport system permease protein
MATAASLAGTRAEGIDWGGILKDSLLAAVIALSLTITLVGVHTVAGAGSQLTIETRLADVGVAVALVFLGRLALGLIRNGLALPALAGAVVVAVAGVFVPMPSGVLRLIAVGGGAVLALHALIALWRHRGGIADRQDRERAMDRFSAQVQRATIYIAPVAIAFAIVLPFLPISDRTTIDTATLILTYVMLGWGLNIIVGLAGLLDLGYVAFYAIGAYSYGLLAFYFDLSFWAALPLAGVLASLGGLALGFPVLRLRGDYFAIVTLGFGEIIRIILLNWYSFTNGPNGISNIPRPSFFGIADFERNPEEGQLAFHQLFGLDYDTLHRVIFLYYLILILALIVNVVTIRVRRLPIGRSWEALREDDIACQSLGINRRNIKLAAFMMSATFGGFAGSFFATRQGFISPESFTFIESAIVLAIVVLGGMGSQMGVVLAAVLVVGLPEIFRGLEEYRMLVFGGAMVAIMVWRPRGLLAHRDPTIRLHGKRHLQGEEGRKAAAREEAAAS